MPQPLQLVHTGPPNAACRVDDSIGKLSVRVKANHEEIYGRLEELEDEVAQLKQQLDKGAK